MIDFTGGPRTKGDGSNTTTRQTTVPTYDTDFDIDPFADTDPKFAGKVRRLAATFRELNLEVPEQLLNGPVTSPGAVNGMIVEHAPTAREDHLDKAARALANGEDPTEHLIRHNAWSDANQGELKARVFNLQRQNMIDLLHQHADSITEQIRAALFTPSIRALKDLLKANPGKQWDLETAVSTGDYIHAATIKDNQKHAATLARAVEIRAGLYNEQAFTTDAALATTPGLSAKVGKPQPDSLNWWMSLLTNGIEPHFPTAAEWHALNTDKEFTEHRDEIARRKAEQQPEVKSVAPATQRRIL